MASRLFHVAELLVGRLLIAEERIAVHVYICWDVAVVGLSQGCDAELLCVSIRTRLSTCTAGFSEA